jgi:TolB-like protein
MKRINVITGRFASAMAVLCAGLLLPMLMPSAPAVAAPAAGPTTTPALVVALLDFQTDTPGNPDLGKQIAETLTATLSSEDGIKLVDRTDITQMVREHELNLTGLVNPDDAVKIGHLVGAKILITGKAFTIDKSVFITAKLIGTETSLVSGVVVKGKLDADMGDLVMDLSDKIVARLHDSGAGLVASTEVPVDPLVALKAKLATRRLPVIAIEATDQHIGPRLRAIDPPVDNTLRTMLTETGFTVIDKDVVDMGKAGVGLVVKADGFSEYSVAVGQLISCSARVELTVNSYADDKTIYSDTATSRATDLSENIAGKTALQKSTHEVGLRMLQKLADTLPAADAPAPATRP